MSPGSSACSWVDATPAIASDSGLALIHICPFVQVSGQQACISALLLKLSSWALGSESRSVVSDCFQLHGLYPVLGILQCRMLAWVAFPFSRASSRPRDQTQDSLGCIGRGDSSPAGLCPLEAAAMGSLGLQPRLGVWPCAPWSWPWWSGVVLAWLGTMPSWTGGDLVAPLCAIGAGR